MWRDKQVDYWIPGTKKDLVSWLAHHYGTTQGKFQKLKKTQLYAIYFKTRNGGGQKNAKR